MFTLYISHQIRYRLITRIYKFDVKIGNGKNSLAETFREVKENIRVYLTVFL